MKCNDKMFQKYPKHRITLLQIFRNFLFRELFLLGTSSDALMPSLRHVRVVIKNEKQKLMDLIMINLIKISKYAILK